MMSRVETVAALINSLPSALSNLTTNGCVLEYPAVSNIAAKYSNNHVSFAYPSDSNSWNIVCFGGYGSNILEIPVPNPTHLICYSTG
jgi:hypothetical protein